MPALDVYKDWLGIPDKNRPLDRYQLLRVNRFEDDVTKIRERYRKLNAHVRKFATGEFAKQSQDLLNELTQAMLCLTDQKRKAEYDASLGRKDSEQTGLKPLEMILLGRQLITPDQLQKARKYADAVGLELRDALVQQKVATTELVWQAYADSLGLPFIDLGDVQVEGALIVSLPALLCRQHSVMPLVREKEFVSVASPTLLSPGVEDELRMRLGAPVRCVLCTVPAMTEMINKHYTKSTAEAEIASGRHQTMGVSQKTEKFKQEKKADAAGPQKSAEEKQKMRVVVSFTIAMLALFAAQFVFGFDLLMAMPIAVVLGGLVFGVMAALKL